MRRKLIGLIALMVQVIGLSACSVDASPPQHLASALRSCQLDLPVVGNSIDVRITNSQETQYPAICFARELNFDWEYLAARINAGDADFDVKGEGVVLSVNPDQMNDNTLVFRFTDTVGSQTATEAYARDLSIFWCSLVVLGLLVGFLSRRLALRISLEWLIAGVFPGLLGFGFPLLLASTSGPEFWGEFMANGGPTFGPLILIAKSFTGLLVVLGVASLMLLVIRWMRTRRGALHEPDAIDRQNPRENSLQFSPFTDRRKLKLLSGTPLDLTELMTELWDEWKEASKAHELAPTKRRKQKADRLYAQWQAVLQKSVAEREEQERREATKKRVSLELKEEKKRVSSKKPAAAQPRVKKSVATKSAGSSAPKKMGKSTLIRPLGSGNFGQVWLGTMPHGPENVPREVAVKIVKQGLFDASKQDEVLREMVLLSKLNNPHVVSLLDWPKGAKQEKFWFTTEYVSDRNLQWHIVSNVFETRGHSGKLPIQRLKRYAEQIFIALAAVERKSIVHKDIKPDNIAITKDGRTIKILDFGLGFVRGKNSSDTRNYFYSAPELIRGQHEPTPKADVYSTGLTILSAILGRDWFEGLNLDEIEYTISKLGPRWEGVDPKAVEFLKPLLAFDPRDRPSAVEVLRHLESASYFVPWPRGSREYKVAAEFTDTQLRRYAAWRG